MNDKTTILNAETSPILLVINPFEVEAFLAEDHVCGGWDTHFRTDIVLESSSLDENGFVVENMSVIKAIRDFFKGKVYVASCEQLCQCIARICHDLAPNRLTRINVKVYNLTGHLEINWKRGQALPPLPHCV